MLHEDSKKRGQVKGYLFEIAVRTLIEKNNFTFIQDTTRIRTERRNFTEMQGRGGWHQIDVPYDYMGFVPFINSIRILGEVKMYKGEVQKQAIQEYIGVIKDISENYFALDATAITSRYTEVPVFFSANGFTDEAECLAFAHGIKTISYKNNTIIDRIKQLIQDLESRHLNVNMIFDNEMIGEMKSLFYELLNTTNIDSIIRFSEQLATEGDLIPILSQIREVMISINSSFIGTTSGGAIIHFIGNDVFPDNIFRDTDEAITQVHYENLRGRLYFSLSFRDFPTARYFFSPPVGLNEVAFRENPLNEKERLFRTINISKKIGNVQRSLQLSLDSDWLFANRN